MIALKWTKTSGHCSCSIKPKPFESLKNLTLPVTKSDISISYLRLCSYQLNDFPARKKTVIADGIERKETEECLLTAIINKTNF